MPDPSQIVRSPAVIDAPDTNPPTEPFVMVIFGASGDLTKRLLVPALYNLQCDGLLNEHFAVLGTSTTAWDTKSFREQMSTEIKKFHTRKEFDQAAWEKLVNRFYYVAGSFTEMKIFDVLKTEVKRLDAEYRCEGNTLFYFAVAPRFFGTLCDNLHAASFKAGPGWKRVIVEKPFGTSLESALQLNREVLANWSEDQIYRIDHYLGKETVQNLLAFRFSNGIWEPLWNNNYIDNIQFNVSEAVDVEGRGGYYDSSGVLRDMMQNHMFQMLAYLCMEVPGSFSPDAIRNEKAKLLQSVRRYRPDEVERNAVRGQYGPSRDKPGYRQEKDVKPDSKTETYAAVKLAIDNWRWNGVPVYLRSGKALWKRGTEIVVEFKKAPEVIFRGTPVTSLNPNTLIFHIQPYQGIEIQFQAKVPGPRLQLQPVNMKFGYGDAFKAARYTGYEVMLYSCSHGDATLFSRGDLVEAAWGVAQPILDYWSATPAPEFPNYERSTWGPKAAADLIAADGRRWHEVVTEDVLKQSPLFKEGDPVFLDQVIMALKPLQASAGDELIRRGDLGKELYLIEQGEVEVIDAAGAVIRVLKDGDTFGEVGLLMSQPRNATCRARTQTDLYVLEKPAFSRILRDNPLFAAAIQQVAKERFQVDVETTVLIAP
jgi:glucose-6-phosphate 1-dehydrogenase